MTARERVITALNNKKPDRIPRYEIFLPDFVNHWREIKRVGNDANIYDWYPKIDIGAVLATQEGPFIGQKCTKEIDDDIYWERNSWGILKRYNRSGYFFEVLETAIKEKGDLDKLQFEDPHDPTRYADIVAHEKSIHDRFAPVSGVMGLFMPSWYLRGEIPFLMDLVDDEQFCRALVEKIAAFLTVVGENVLRYTNTWNTAIWVYDDFGTNQTTLISPGVFERIFLIPYKKMISYWKSKGAQNIILHFDGNSLPVMDLLLEAGFTGVQGVYPTTGMTIPAVKAKYGKRLSLIGGMCNIHILSKGTHQNIEREVKSIVEVAKDGGVIIGAHSVDRTISLENYDYYYDVLEKLDKTW
ncbi:MAG: uroporphyrinogen decarboxylase family protein [Candidatus Omnitrophota bacterium]